MSTPKLEINNMISAVAVGNPQSVQAETMAGGEKSAFMSLFAGVRGISGPEAKIAPEIDITAEALTGAEKEIVTAETSTTDEAVVQLMASQQPTDEGGKPLPEVGNGLPAEPDQEVVLPAVSEMTKERPFTMVKEAAEVTLNPAVPVDSAVPTDADLLEQHTTYLQPEAYFPQQTATGYAPEQKLPAVVIDTAAVVQRGGLIPDLQSDIEINVEAAVQSMMSPQQELTQNMPVKSAIGSIAMQSLLEKDLTRLAFTQESAGAVLKTVLREQPAVSAVNTAEAAIESQPVTSAEAIEVVAEEAEGIKQLIDKKADLLMTAAQSTRSVVTDRSAVLEAMQSVQLDGRLSELKTALQPPPQTRVLPDTFVLPETIAMRQPNWNQNLGNNILWMVKEDLQSASIRVKPAELGPLNIQVSLQQEQLQVSISAHHTAAREALEAALPRLREQFASQGFQQVNVDISQQHERTSSGEQESGSDLTQGSSIQVTESALPSEDDFADPQMRGYSTHNGLVDAFA